MRWFMLCPQTETPKPLRMMRSHNHRVPSANGGKGYGYFTCNSSSVTPDLSTSLIHAGWLPRPDHVCLGFSGLRYVSFDRARLVPSGGKDSSTIVPYGAVVSSARKRSLDRFLRVRMSSSTSFASLCSCTTEHQQSVSIVVMLCVICDGSPAELLWVRVMLCLASDGVKFFSDLWFHPDVSVLRRKMRWGEMAKRQV